jgi:hypothetical protein
MQPVRLRRVAGAEDRHADEAVRVLEGRGRGEGLAVERERGPGVGGAGGAEVMGEGERQAEPASQLGAVAGGAEQPQRGLVALGRDGPDPWLVGGLLAGCVGREVGPQFRQLAGEVRRRQPVGAAPQGARGFPVGAGSPPDPEVDPPRVQRLQGAELLGHGERRMVRKHHPARADPDGRGGRRELAREDGRGRAGDARQAVVLGNPVPGEAKPLGVPGQVDAAAKRLADRFPGGHRAQVEYRQRNAEAGGHNQKTGSRAAPQQPGPWRTVRLTFPLGQAACSGGRAELPGSGGDRWT